MYEIMVEQEFSAAHQIKGYEGVCRNLHGHNWKVQVILKVDNLNKLNMVRDFDEIKEIINKIIKPLDHQYLNELPQFADKNPTSEIIAEYIYFQMKLIDVHLPVVEVRVWETSTTYASYKK
jgi:6-pyruvoyltetrahydropterin/6-carboxytetrahydropterin synthase